MIKTIGGVAMWWLAAGCGNISLDHSETAAFMMDSLLSSTNRYCYISGKTTDSVLLSVDLSGREVSGELLYALSGKDLNEGTVQGHWRGDTLFLDYLFQSEGKLTSRELAFLKKDSMLLEGYGESRELEGRLKFTDRQKISFGSGVQLIQVNCDPVSDNAVGPASTVAVLADQGNPAISMHRWELKALKGKEIEPGRRSHCYLQFTPGQVGTVSGKGGCNRITGSFELIGKNGLKLGALVTTKMACPNMEQEAEFLAMLGEADQWKIEAENELILLKNGQLLAVFQPAGAGKQE